jgi:hypothetical protein
MAAGSICRLPAPELDPGSIASCYAVRRARWAWVDCASFGFWTAERLGQLVKLGFEERARLRLSHLRPYDIRWEDLQRRSGRARQAKYAAKRRAAKQAAALEKKDIIAQASDIDARADALWFLLGHGEWSVQELVGIIKENPGPAWRTREGQQLKTDSLARAIHRELDLLKASGSVEERRKQTGRGQPQRFVRRPTRRHTQKAHLMSASPPTAARKRTSNHFC